MIRKAIGPPTLTGRGQADVVGMFGLKWLVDHGILPREKLERILRVVCCRNFSHRALWRGEPHGQAEMMEFNYLSERGGIKRQTSGQYAI